MAKEKTPKGKESGKNRHIKARILYLHRAASLLTEAKKVPGNSQISTVHDDVTPATKPTTHPFPEPARLLFEARMMSLKSQIRMSSLSPDFNLKDQICRRCSTPLNVSVLRQGDGHIKEPESIQPSSGKATQTVTGPTSRLWTENKSKNGGKAWADVRVLRCRICGTEKRWPVGSSRQKRRKERQKGAGPLTVTI